MSTIAEIQKATSYHFQVPISEILSKDRHKYIVTARQVAVYLSRELTNHSFNVIGRQFKRDKSTVISSFNRIVHLGGKNSVIANDIREIIGRIK